MTQSRISLPPGQAQANLAGAMESPYPPGPPQHPSAQAYRQRPRNSGLMQAAIVLMLVNGILNLLGMLVVGGAFVLFGPSDTRFGNDDKPMNGTELFYGEPERAQNFGPGPQIDLQFDGRGNVPSFAEGLIQGTMVVVALLSILSTVMYLLCALWLHERRFYWACVIIAALSCLSFPLGTVAGVLALVALFQEGEREAFERNRYRAPYERHARYRYPH